MKSSQVFRRSREQRPLNQPTPKPVKEPQTPEVQMETKGHYNHEDTGKFDTVNTDLQEVVRLFLDGFVTIQDLRDAYQKSLEQ